MDRNIEIEKRIENEDNKEIWKNAIQLADKNPSIETLKKGVMFYNFIFNAKRQEFGDDELWWEWLKEHWNDYSDIYPYLQINEYSDTYHKNNIK